MAGSFALHHWGASLMVILLLFHIIQVFVWGAYKKPREFTWMIGVLLLATTLGMAFTGYLLPWDEKAYWATKVGLGIVSTVPVIGQSLRTLMQGGSQIGNLTLTRFFALHAFVLPGLLISLVVVHLYFFRTHGVTPNWWHSESELDEKKEPFWPGQAWKDLVLIFVLLLGLGIWCFFIPAPLGAVADPAKPYAARPEWYFMFMFQILKYFPPPYEVVATFILPALFFTILFFWPFLDRTRSRDPRKRPIAITLLGLGSLGLVGLTIFSIVTNVRMHEPSIAVAKAATPPQPAAALQRLNVPDIFSNRCAPCHGLDGAGSPAIRMAMPTLPNFTDFEWQQRQSDELIKHRIESGKPPLMPSFKGKLTPEEVRWLAFYVRSFAIRPPASDQTSSDETPSTTPSTGP